LFAGVTGEAALLSRLFGCLSVLYNVILVGVHGKPQDVVVRGATEQLHVVVGYRLRCGRGAVGQLDQSAGAGRSGRVLATV